MKQCDEAERKALETAEAWYESHRNSKGNVNTNVMTSGIAVAELIREQFPFTAEPIKLFLAQKNEQCSANYQAPFR
jgi:hypothetical protein